jgi:D-serine dehydratase
MPTFYFTVTYGVSRDPKTWKHSTLKVDGKDQVEARRKIIHSVQGKPKKSEADLDSFVISIDSITEEEFKKGNQTC